MKKYIYYLFLVIASFMLVDLIFPKFFRSTPQDELISKTEEKLTNSMNDPESYEFVSFEEDYVYSDSIRKSDEKFNKDENVNLKYNYHILTFRGKNKIGALILDEVLVKSSDNVVLELIDLK